MLATGSEKMDGASAVEPRLWTTGFAVGSVPELVRGLCGMDNSGEGPVSLAWLIGTGLLERCPPGVKSSAHRRMPSPALCEQQVLG